MGDPKKHRKKYSGPGHPWQKERIDEEAKLKVEYGIKNKTEIWRMNSFLREISDQAKSLVTREGVQADKEKEQLLARVKRYGLLPTDATIDAILSITLRDVLERRLETQVYKKNFSHSAKQARQFITHRHVSVKGKLITSPSYIVSVEEEAQIEFHEKSALCNPEHPERAVAQKVVEEEAKQKIVEKK